MKYRTWGAYKQRSIFDYEHGAGAEVTGLLIGHSVPDTNLLIACEAAHVNVLVYDFVDGVYQFASVPPAIPPQLLIVDHKDFVRGAVGNAILDVIQNRIEKDAQQQKRTIL